ncbi:MAG: DUF2793 domain-containing protein [Devosia nanyangense]|uniref:DUF2793 domain-containing protein n=1 Tax=Devosia nanyangense TaxID=1228055 RepID=A0A933L0Q8_9HYPH|nr:DUF2793 domain-containing protein [Devosia nanyangense]
MSATARLTLPYIAPQQAQKQVTYNQAMAALDQLVQPSVKSRTVTAPPGSPAEGDTYIVGPSATGAWAGKDGKFACWLSGAWSFRTPADGWLAYVVDTAEIAVCQSGAWSPLVSNGGAGVAKFGINTTADLTNRLAVAADASLFTHTGTSHRMKLNKASAADTASLLFQDNFSGRAEFGLAGDDAVHVKVSPNGSSWYEALTIAQGSGLVTLPIGQLAFPAAQNPSANANTLDDYEEGTWTPGMTFGGSAAGIAYSAQYGNYVKIGRLVFFNLYLALTSNGSGTGAAVVTGLPFASDGSGVGSTATMSIWGGMSGVVGTPVGLVNAGATTISLNMSGATAHAVMTDTNITNSASFGLSGCYLAAS